jgi:hypothetical protein
VELLNWGLLLGGGGAEVACFSVSTSTKLGTVCDRDVERSQGRDIAHTFLYLELAANVDRRCVDTCWALGSGLWALGSGLWALDVGRWTIEPSKIQEPRQNDWLLAGRDLMIAGG